MIIEQAELVIIEQVGHIVIISHSDSRTGGLT